MAKRLKDVMIMPLKASHFKRARYTNNATCPMARAAKDFFGADVITEHVRYLRIYSSKEIIYSHEWYGLLDWASDKKEARKHKHDDTIIRSVTLTRA